MLLCMTHPARGHMPIRPLKRHSAMPLQRLAMSWARTNMGHSFKFPVIDLLICSSCSLEGFWYHWVRPNLAKGISSFSCACALRCHSLESRPESRKAPPPPSSKLQLHDHRTWSLEGEKTRAGWRVIRWLGERVHAFSEQHGGIAPHLSDA
jgi:hypothetical protein